MRDLKRNKFNDLVDFQILASGVLGKREFIDIAEFFGSIIKIVANNPKNTHVLYFISRRCYILWNIFYDYFMACKDSMKLDASESPVFEEIKPMMEDFLNIDLEMVQQYIISDTFFYYLNLKNKKDKYEQIPHIIIVEDLLNHGKTINNFLLKIERSLETENKSEINLLTNIFINHISIYSYAKKNDILLLMPRYREQLKVYKVLSKISWRDLFARIDRLVVISPLSNAGIFWDIRTPVLEDNGRSYPLYDNIYDVFHHYRTGIQDTLEDNFIYLYPSDSCVKAICTVRSKRSLLPLCTGKFSCENYQMYVPYIILDGLPIANIEKLYYRISKDFKQTQKNNFDYLFKIEDILFQNETNLYQRFFWFFDIDRMILHLLLLRRFFGRVLGYTKQQILNLSEYIDFQKLRKNYNWLRFINNDVMIEEEIDGTLKSVWLWDCSDKFFDEYMEILLNEVSPFWNNETFGDPNYSDYRSHILCDSKTEGSNNPIIVPVLNVIVNMGIDEEIFSQNQISSNIEISDDLLSSFREINSIRSFLSKCQESFSEYSNYQEGIPVAADLYQVSSVLLRAMDLGLVGMNLLYGKISPEKSSFESLFTMIKAGEQALFILPNRFREFIAVLLKMEERWGKSREDFKIDIQRFSLEYCKKNKGIDESSSILESSAKLLSNDLLYFMESIWRSGQNIAEWDFALFRTQGLMCPAPWDPTKVLLPSAMYAKDQLKQQNNLDIYNRI